MTDTCPICGRSHLSLLFVQERVPIFQNKVYDTQELALASQVGKVRLVQCVHCGFVFNQDFEPGLMVYDKSYHNEQGYSDVFKQHLKSVMELLTSFDLNGKKVVEIGCGKGYFMEMLAEQRVDITGFDPTYEGENPRVIKDYFSKQYSDLKADVIILRHTLEHIPNVRGFLAEVAEANGNAGQIFIEVPTFDWILQKQSFWDVFYEHCNYFTEDTLAQLFRKRQSGSVFGGQYIYLWADLSTLKSTIESNGNRLHKPLSFVESIAGLKRQLETQTGKTAIWGAAAKGSTFLNLLDPHRDRVKYVVDINPAKQNKFIAGTGHPIFHPDVIKTREVENVIVMNENYLNEVISLVDNPRINITSI